MLLRVIFNNRSQDQRIGVDTVIESNDQSKKAAQVRARRRKNAAWKSGLMLGGLGAVVLGAGYLAGVNAPATAQSASETVARTGAANSNTAGNQLAPTSGFSSNDAQGFQFNGDDGQGALGDEGTFQFRGGGSNGQFNQQFGTQGSRQFRGSTQPGFSRPLTRSRGS